MANFYGVTIKKLKWFRGTEGYAAQGDVYLNGKKLGFWSEDANGSICDTFDFKESLLADAIAKANASSNYKFEDTESFMTAVVSLIELEKTYKKELKKGYNILIAVNSKSYGIVNSHGSVAVSYDLEGRSKADIKKARKYYESCKSAIGLLNEVKKFYAFVMKLDKNPDVEYTITTFLSLDDFNIS